MSDRDEKRAEDAAGRGEAGCRADDLKGVLQQLAEQIADADRRHSQVLSEMHKRLARLGGETQTVKAALPRHLASAFARIEEGMSQLAERLSETEGGRRMAPDADPEPAGEQPVALAHAWAAPASAPVVLQAIACPDAETAAPAAVEPPPLSPEPADLVPRPTAVEPDPRPDALAPAAATASAAPAPTAAASTSHPVHAPPPLRSAIGLQPPGTWGRSEPPAAARPSPAPEPVYVQDPDEPWDVQSAAALARLYESGEPGLPPLRSGTEVQSEVPQNVPPAAAPAVAAAPTAAEVVEQRAWLETRFADIAARVECSLAELRPEASLSALGQRFDHFEERFSSALDGIATRADVEGLRIVEAHIAELTSEIESTRGHLSRLDAIERQLGELSRSFSDEEIVRLLSGAVPTEDDLVRFAEEAATRVASRLADRPPPPEAQGLVAKQAVEAVQSAQASASRQMSMLQEMLAGFMDERRRGEAMTADALETMQQALQHMLDRVDAIEAAQFAPLQPALPQSVQLEAMRATPPPAPLAPAELPRGAGPAPRSFAEEAKAAARLAAAAEATARAQARPAVADLDAGRIEPRLEDPAAADPDRTTAHIVREPARDARAAARPSAPPDRSAFIAMARRAAEQVKSDPDSGTAANGPPAAPARGASLKYRLFGGGEAGSARSGVRPGVLLVASLAFFLFAGYWFVASPRFRTIGASPPVQRGAVVPADPKAQPRPAASPAIESEAPPLPKEAAPQPTAPEAPPRRRRSVPETGVDDLGALPRREDHATLPHSVAAPGAPAAPGPTYGIALQQGPRQPTPEEIIRSRQTAHLASLSQRTAHDAARTASVPASHVPSGVLDPAPGDNPAAPAQAAPPARQTVELPPAAIGPLSLRLAAAKGDPSAQFDVAARFAEGRGVKQDFEQAAQWYQRAATQGLAQAQYRLAALHERGLGVKGEPARARIWYKRAAEQGNLKAMHNLAVMSTGRDGAPADYPAAIQWFAEAAERGLTDSQFNLGVLHESGLGAGRDVVAAYKWYALAARGGDKEALRRRDLLASKLDAASLAAGEAAVAQWRPRAVDALANDPRAAGDAWKQRAAAGQGQ